MLICFKCAIIGCKRMPEQSDWCSDFVKANWYKYFSNHESVGYGVIKPRKKGRKYGIKEVVKNEMWYLWRSRSSRMRSL